MWEEDNEAVEGGQAEVVEESTTEEPAEAPVESEAQKSDRLDTMRHNSYKRKKARGLDDRILKEVSTYKKRLTQEGRSDKRSPAKLVGAKDA